MRTHARCPNGMCCSEDRSLRARVIRATYGVPPSGTRSSFRKMTTAGERCRTSVTHPATKVSPIATSAAPKLRVSASEVVPFIALSFPLNRRCNTSSMSSHLLHFVDVDTFGGLMYREPGEDPRCTNEFHKAFLSRFCGVSRTSAQIVPWYSNVLALKSSCCAISHTMVVKYSQNVFVQSHKKPYWAIG